MSGEDSRRYMTYCTTSTVKGVWTSYGVVSECQYEVYQVLESGVLVLERIHRSPTCMHHTNLKTFSSTGVDQASDPTKNSLTTNPMRHRVDEVDLEKYISPNQLIDLGQSKWSWILTWRSLILSDQQRRRTIVRIHMGADLDQMLSHMK
jgi:hypothetical protein